MYCLSWKVSLTFIDMFYKNRVWRQLLLLLLLLGKISNNTTINKEVINEENHNVEIKIDLGFEYLVCINLLMRETPLFIHDLTF